MIFKFVNPISVCQNFTIRFYSLVNRTSRGQHVGLTIGRGGFDICKFVNKISVCQNFTIRFYSLVNRTSRGQHVGLAIGRAGFDTR